VEVILTKPVHDSLTYEKPLPLDLLPFVIRNDHYLPIGTAFAIGPNRYVTAAHVLRAAAESSFGTPLVRGPDGRPREVQSILAFSMREDFAIFSVQPGTPNAFLDVKQQRSIGTGVYAVGNALGEGIVIRDGLLTSETPEERNGEWNWLRFSAAASPGNSGGPLLDSRGNVIGVVLGKSPNENLNFALPIDRVVHASSKSGRIDFRQSFRLPIMSATTLATLQTDFALPESCGDFASKLAQVENDFFDKAEAQFLEENGGAIFPHGTGSEKLLTTTYSEKMPSVITQQDDGTWDAPEAAGITTGSLPGGGVIQYGTSAGWVVVQVQKPEDVTVKSLFSDSKLYMDMVLKGVKQTRQVADQAIRITSLGPAKQEEWLMDSYGRKWQLRVWPLEFADAAVISFALPKPNGFAALILLIPSGLMHATIGQGKYITNLIYTSYAGSLRDWSAFLTEKDRLPDAFDRVRIDAQYDHSFRYLSSRVNLTFGGFIQNIKPDSWLTLSFAYFRDGKRVVWDVGSIVISEDHKGSSTVDVRRLVQPPANSTSDAKAEWAQMINREGSYDDRPHFSDGSSWISRGFIKGEHGHDPPRSDSTVVYSVTYSANTYMQPATAQRIHDSIVSSMKVLE
jgi:serine protease Do